MIDFPCKYCGRMVRVADGVRTVICTYCLTILATSDKVDIESEFMHADWLEAKGKRRKAKELRKKTLKKMEELGITASWEA